MSLFTKTIVVRGGLSDRDVRALEDVVTQIAEAAKERLQGLDKEIEELRKEIAILKRAPRMSVAQKIKVRR